MIGCSATLHSEAHRTGCVLFVQQTGLKPRKSRRRDYYAIGWKTKADIIFQIQSMFSLKVNSFKLLFFKSILKSDMDFSISSTQSSKIVQVQGMSVPYSSHFFPSFFEPKHLGKQKLGSSPCASSQALHWAAATSAAATHKTKHLFYHTVYLAFSKQIRTGLFFVFPVCVPRFSQCLILFNVEIAFGSAEWLKAGELFSQVSAKWGGAAREEFQPSRGAALSRVSPCLRSGADHSTLTSAFWEDISHFLDSPPSSSQTLWSSSRQTKGKKFKTL